MPQLLGSESLRNGHAVAAYKVSSCHTESHAANGGGWSRRNPGLDHNRSTY